MTETNFQILLPSPLHTHQLGVQIAQNAPPRLVIALSGTLGSGKTCMVRGIAEGLGIKENVNSPTFTLINEYHSGSRPLYHIDLYRLQSDDQGNSESKLEVILEPSQALKETAPLILELNEIFEQPNAVVAIEWAELLQNYLSPDCLQISLSYVKDGTARTAQLTGPGAKLIMEAMKTSKPRRNSEA